MMKKRSLTSRLAFGCLASSLVVGVTGCPDIKVDPGEGVADRPPTVEFDPANAIVPFPNNLVVDQTTKKVTLPAQLCESPTSKAVREGVLNKLDGFGTYEAAMSVTFTAAPDMASVTDHVVLYKKTTPLTVVPTLVLPTVSIRYKDASSCTTPTLVPALAIIPMVPLEQNTTYDVAILDGLTTGGMAFAPSGTWSLVRNKVDPVTLDGVDGSGNPIITVNNTPLDPSDKNGLAQIVGIDTLWKAHSGVLTALDAAGHPRDKVLLAWELTTQTVTSPLDPTVTDSLAANHDGHFAGFAFPAAGLAAGQGEAFLVGALGQATCDALGCANVGDVLGAQFGSTQFQQPVTNPLAGEPPTPGAWNDPIHPTEADLINPNLTALIATPKTAMPPNGWPLVIFGHGLGSSKSSLAVFAPQLAGQGFASVAIDFVDHGSRAIRTRNDAECADVGGKAPDPTVLQECFALFLSTDLAATRDNIRQTVLDLQALHKALVKCSTGTGCAGPDGIQFKVDATKVVYAGISLGGIIGSTFVSLTPGVKAAVLNVPGVGLIDIIENTGNIGIRCTLVNALIDAGVVSGDKWTGSTTGLCVEADQGWKTQPGYQQFSAIARWALDPADGANYVGPRLPTKKFLIQEVVNDQVVPNIATDREAALVGFTTPALADSMPSPAVTMQPPVASAAITTNPFTSKWVRYTNLPADANAMFPGNSFQHASLLAPVTDSTGAGKLGTLRVQIDAITFLVANQ